MSSAHGGGLKKERVVSPGEPAPYSPLFLKTHRPIGPPPENYGITKGRLGLWALLNPGHFLTILPLMGTRSWGVGRQAHPRNTKFERPKIWATLIYSQSLALFTHEARELLDTYWNKAGLDALVVSTMSSTGWPLPEHPSLHHWPTSQAFRSFPVPPPSSPPSPRNAVLDPPKPAGSSKANPLPHSLREAP